MDLDTYRGLFVSEARDRLAHGYDLLAAMEQGQTRHEQLMELMRCAHSLKGMAATLDFRSMVSLAHAIEELLELSLRHDAAGQWPWHEWLADGIASMGAIVDAVEQQQDAESAVALRLAERLRRRIESLRDGDRATLGSTRPDPRSLGSHVASGGDATGREAAGAGPTIGSPAVASRPGAQRATPASHAPTDPRKQFRIRIDLEDVDPISGADPTVRVLGNLASLGRVVQVHPPQLSLATGRFDGRLDATIETELSAEAIRELLSCLSGIGRYRVEPVAKEQRAREAPANEPPWVRVRGDLLDRALDASLQLLLDLRRNQARGEAAHAESVPAVEQQARRTYEQLASLRRVPFRTVRGRIEQSARQLAAELERPLRFALAGGEVYVDRALLDGLLDPLTHAVRNAIDHGIEPPVERQAAGKPAHGRIQLRAQLEGERLRVSVEDDGRGIDPVRIRERAVATGHLDPDGAETLDDRRTLELITLPGFSTRSDVGSISGRGIGMDIVRRNVEAFGGRLSIDSRPGRGTRLNFDLPLRRALVRALLIRCRDERFAVPSSWVHHVAALDRSQRGTRRSRQAASAGVAQSLAQRLGVATPCSGGESGSQVTVWVAHAGGQRGWHVDEILGERDLLVEPLALPLRGLRRFAGAALDESGDIVLIVDPAHL